LKRKEKKIKKVLDIIYISSTILINVNELNERVNQMLSSTLYAETTAEIDIQELVDFIKDLEAKVERLENLVQDMDATLGAIEDPSGADYVTNDMLADEIKSILREDVTISVEIDC